MDIKNNITFANASSDDAEFYFQIRKTTIRPYIEKYRKWDEEAEHGSIASKVDPEHDRIILSGGKAIGLFGVKENEDVIYLSMFNIMPEYQNKGIGTRILNSVKDTAKKLGKCIRLDTYQNNSGAIRFYLKNGFEITDLERTPDKYPKILMEYRP